MAQARCGQTVLVVEDDALVVELLTIVLGAKGFRVLAADDGAGMEAALAACRADVILMDMRLRGTDGITLTSRLKADPRTCDIPVVALTGLATAADEVRARGAGCAAYLSKPFRPQAVVDLVQHVLGA